MLVNNNDSSITAPKGESMPTDCYEKERLRQASKGFNLGHYLTTGGAVIFLANLLLFLSGNISAATATTAGGLASGAIVYGSKLCKEASDRLNNVAKADEEEVE